MDFNRRIRFFHAIIAIVVLCYICHLNKEACAQECIGRLLKPKTSAGVLFFKTISRGKISGEYQAVPDACRLKNGDIVVVFYAGDNHVTVPGKKYPKAGRICLVRSHDEGRTWSKPVVIYDDMDNNRDPHINQLSDGSLVCSFFSLKFDCTDSGKEQEAFHPGKELAAKFSNNPDLLKEQKISDRDTISHTRSTPVKWTGQGPFIIKSDDDGRTWEKEARSVPVSAGKWYCSAKVREMPDGTWLLPVYHVEPSGVAAWGGVIPSHDRGITWEKEVPIGREANLVLAAETDIVILHDNSLYAALRGDGSRVNMHYATSKDLGKTWTPVHDMGFVGHAPSFTRLKSGEILLSFRAYDPKKGYYTGLRISRDEAQTWEGPYLVDEKIGAYPSTVELTDGTVLIIYYEEGNQSAVRALRFRMPEPSGMTEFPTPDPVEILPLE